MGTTKHDAFSERQNEIAQLLKALGHPARIAIVEELLRKKTCICGDLVLTLPLAQATISQHLKALKEAGIIQGEIAGVSTCYCLNEKTFLKIENYFSRSNQKIAKQIKCC
jgi:DNA-binding transcriptional ArsR family regulator